MSACDRQDRVKFLVAYEELCKEHNLMLTCGCSDSFQCLARPPDINRIEAMGLTPSLVDKIEEHIKDIWAETFQH